MRRENLGAIYILVKVPLTLSTMGNIPHRHGLSANILQHAYTECYFQYVLPVEAGGIWMGTAKLLPAFAYTGGFLVISGLVWGLPALQLFVCSFECSLSPIALLLL